MIDSIVKDLIEQLKISNPMKLANLIMKLRFTSNINAKTGRITIKLDCATTLVPIQTATISEIRNEVEALSTDDNQLIVTLSKDELIIERADDALANADNIDKIQAGSKIARSLPENPWGINIDEIRIPEIKPGSKVLEINAGNGLRAKKIRDDYSCEVNVLVPNYDNDNDYEQCVKVLGKEYVEKISLEDIVDSYPEKYLNKFDVACIFDYNIPYPEKDEFIESLSRVMKKDGIVYICSLHPEQFYLNMVLGRSPYITKTVKQFFDNIAIEEITTDKGCYGLMTLRDPKSS